jgi:aryl-alcohol dehydrogenase
VNALAPGGTVALIAAPNGTTRLKGGRKAISIVQGDSVPHLFIPKLISLFSGKFPFDRLEKIYDFKDINRAIRDATRGDTIKPLPKIGKV